MPTEKRFFAYQLRALREEAGLTQAVLAERAGIAENTIRQFESGRREPTYETLVKLTKGLGQSLAAFDQPDNWKPPKTPKGKKS